ncbi:MAG: ankyrin repeat domain-containing protein [Candidatus Eremiobacteraeota bacterium]|nr:ankyrin repeat domain-containing protein [Candidatus Eremiobacteraeota bacterium]
MPTRRLPAQPSLAQLKHQAKDLLKAHRVCDSRALQRLREFHPRMRGHNDEEIAAASLSLADAHLTIAREYGFPSWTKLQRFVELEDARTLDLPAHERIDDPQFRHAVDFMDSGNVEALSEYLQRYPELVRQRVKLLGGNYFQHPGLIEFIAENPTRNGRLPKNAAEVARVILEAGAHRDRQALDSALDLTASSRVARDAGMQRALIDVLCEYGADPNGALVSPLLYGEFDAVNHLLQRGARLTLVAAAALGLTEDVRRLIGDATDEDRRLALALAAQHGRAETVAALLAAGVNPNGFTPGGHSHATALHQAALAGHAEIAQMLLNAGARGDVRDVLYGGTPADWAQHSGHDGLANALRNGVAETHGP